IISTDHFAKKFFDKELTAPILRHGTARHDDLRHIDAIFVKIILRYAGSVIATIFPRSGF
ncbi:MAG: hypothetical protein ACK5YL_01610, partial [Holosporales bacterium]